MRRALEGERPVRRGREKGGESTVTGRREIRGRFRALPAKDHRRSEGLGGPFRIRLGRGVSGLGAS